MLRRPRKAINKKQKGRTNYNIRVNQLRMGGAGTTLPTAILSKEAGEITASQISAMEYVVKRVLKKSGFSSMAVLRSGPRYVLRLFPHRPRSKKPNETGLGRGKGPINS
jgi:ribosomal protein L16/L10AE